MKGLPRIVGVLLTLMLRVFPDSFRARRGDEVRAFVEEAWREAGSPRARGRLLLLVSWDLVTSAPRAWRGRNRGPRTGEGTMGRRHVGFDVLAHAFRDVVRNPAGTGLVVATLAAAIGLSTALFSVVDRILLRPLDYPDAGRLVYVNQARTALDEEATLISGGLLRRLGSADVFEAVEGVALIRQNLTGAGLPRQLEVGWTSPGFLGLLGADPLLGRLMRPDDPEGVVVLSHGLWLTQFGGDPDVVGTSVALDGHAHTIIGVASPDLRLRLPGRRRGQPDLWRGPDSRWQNGDIWDELGAEFGMLRVLARTAPEVAPDRVAEVLEALVAVAAEEDPAYRETGVVLTATPLRERVVEGLDRTLALLFGAVLAVLLIACFNVANLLLVRAHAQRRELAIELALGASRKRLAGTVLARSLLLASAGAGAGTLLAAALVWLIPRVAPAAVAEHGPFAVDARILLFSLACTLGTGLLTGALPALRIRGVDPGPGLAGGRGSTPGSSRVRNTLVVLQLALSLVLLSGAGLLTRSLIRMRAVAPGFETADRMTFSVSVPGARYPWPGPDADRFYRAVEAGTESLPGVVDAGVVWPLPFSGSTWSGDVRAATAPDEARRTADYVLATEGYFSVMDIPLVAGRLWAEGDDRHVVAVSEALARTLWPDGAAVGRTVELDPWGRGLEPFEVVGVVADVRTRDLRVDPAAVAYFDTRGWSWVDWEVDVVARTSAPAAAVLPEIRGMVADLDPEVPVAEVSTVEAYLAQGSAGLRFALLLVGIFGGVALVLAAVGLYGTLAYLVGLQKREIGIRMALGSKRLQITGLVLDRGLRLVGAGVVLGLVGAVLLSGLLDAYLFGVEPGDPTTLVGVATGLMGVGILAALVPARRAGRVDPMTILRSE